MGKLFILTAAHMSNEKSVAVVGCGIFGAMIAIRLAELGMKVKVFERNDKPLSGASFNNQNRLHLGFHYPRDQQTAKQCIRGFDRFKEEFAECILGDFKNMYFIASENSNVSPNEYVKFCDEMALSYQNIDLNKIQPSVKNVDLGIVCNEVVYDCTILRKLILDKLVSRDVVLKLNSTVTNIQKKSNGFLLEINNKNEEYFDRVINCSYAEINRLTEGLGYLIEQRQYEYTMVPIIEWDQYPVGITIMDGKFMTVLPFGQTGNFLLYHVDHTVIEKFVGLQMPTSWLSRESKPSDLIDTGSFFQRIKEECSYFVPELSNARCIGFLKGPRVVLANRDNDDARPSIVKDYKSGYLTVFTGKIDHCIWVADDVVNLLENIT